ncbi:MAG: hypothetical protein HC764_21905 [Pleurocapsa sp. CRU_1_2]|nr:hypothetical protein [Pleurocapsa sp. CRU_1_2]
MAACGGISELAQVNHWLKKLLEKQHHDNEIEGSSESENSSKLLERDVPEGIETEDTEGSVDINEEVFLEEYSPDYEIGMFEEDDDSFL